MKAVQALFIFLTAIVAKDFQKAFSQVSKSWGDKNKVDDLKDRFSIIPDGFDIGKIESQPTSAVVSVKLLKDGKVAILDIEMVRESWPYKPDPYGDWGVLPESIKLSAGKFKKVDDGDEDKESGGKKDNAKKEAEKQKAKRLALLEDLKVDAEKYGIEIKEDSDPNVVADAIFTAAEALKELVAKAEDLGIEIPEGADPEAIKKLIQEAEIGGNQ
jgi:hypothetical protein